MSFGSNGVDWVRSFRKILTRLHGTNYCTTSARFAPSFVRQPNGPKCIQRVRNTPKREFRDQWGGSVAFITKNSDATSCHELLHQVGPFCAECCNATKLSQTHQNIRLASNGVDRMVCCEKIRRHLVARTFASVWPVLHCVL